MSTQGFGAAGGPSSGNAGDGNRTPGQQSWLSRLLRRRTLRHVVGGTPHGLFGAGGSGGQSVWNARDAGGASVSQANAGHRHGGERLRTGEEIDGGRTVGEFGYFVALLLLAAAIFFAVSYGKRNQSAEPATVANPGVRVWTNTQSGLYYCQGAEGYGKGKGKYMTQREARMQQFRAAFEKTCE